MACFPCLPSACVCSPICVPKCPWDYTANTEVTVHIPAWQACGVGPRGRRREDAGSRMGTASIVASCGRGWGAPGRVGKGSCGVARASDTGQSGVMIGGPPAGWDWVPPTVGFLLSGGQAEGAGASECRSTAGAGSFPGPLSVQQGLESHEAPGGEGHPLFQDGRETGAEDVLSRLQKARPQSGVWAPGDGTAPSGCVGPT